MKTVKLESREVLHRSLCTADMKGCISAPSVSDASHAYHLSGLLANVKHTAKRMDGFEA